MSSLRVLGVSESTRIQERIRDAVGTNPEFELLPAVKCVADVVAGSAPDIVVYDLDRDGWEAMMVADIWQAQVPLVVALADELPADRVWRLFRDGVCAVLPRVAAAQEIEAALDAVTQGVLVLSRDLLGDVAPQPMIRPARAPASPAALRVAPPLKEQLTPREHAVMEMLAGGLSNKEMAKQLGISRHTIKYHLASVFGKLGATSRTEAVMIALRTGLVMV
ncbi:MAG TPA: response regulator transcription factor [Steroidobacteraceae bacterium]|jgi:DNA-binding NarL/FixJ family response regulator